MKIRNGFVSNSSSSSFIVGIAKVLNEKKLRKYLKQNEIEESKYGGVTIIKVKDISGQYSLKTVGGKIIAESFQDSVELKTDGLKDDDLIVYTNITNNEGDGAFMDDDGDYCDINYDIDLDFFSEKQQLIYDIFNNIESGVDINSSRVSFGAARNG